MSKLILRFLFFAMVLECSGQFKAQEKIDMAQITAAVNIHPNRLQLASLEGIETNFHTPDWFRIHKIPKAAIKDLITDAPTRSVRWAFKGEKSFWYYVEPTADARFGTGTREGTIIFDGKRDYTFTKNTRNYSGKSSNYLHIMDKKSGNSSDPLSFCYQIPGATGSQWIGKALQDVDYRFIASPTEAVRSQNHRVLQRERSATARLKEDVNSETSGGRTVSVGLAIRAVILRLLSQVQPVSFPSECQSYFLACL